ncbi:MAG: hypothetical protein ACFCGT_28020 [Sandaracinaceae bacterium]
MRRLVLSGRLINMLFQRLALLLRVAKDETVTVRPRVTECELILFPDGVGTFVLVLDWSGRVANLDLLSASLEAARHLEEAKSTHGWRLKDTARHPNAGAGAPARYERDVPPELFNALEHAAPIELMSLVHGILELGSSGASQTISEAASRYAHLHSSILLSSPLPRHERASLAFSLARAYGNRYGAPEADDLPPPWLSRRCRLIEVQREGTLSLSWNDGEAKEWVDWPRRFQGIYQQLVLYILGQREALARMRHRGAAHVEALNEALLTSPEAESVAARRDRLVECRNAVRRWATEVVAHNLLVAHDEGGGLSDYATFVAKLVHRFGVSALRSELREVLREVLALVEVVTREVDEETQNHTAREEERVRRLEEARRNEEADRSQLFQERVGLVALLTIPPSFLASILGIGDSPVQRLSGLPGDSLELMGLHIAACLITAVPFAGPYYFLVWWRGSKRRVEALQAATTARVDDL